MALPQDHIKALDQLRTRLSQLSNSLIAIRDTINNTNEPLPSWPALQADATVLGANLQELANVLNEQRQMFASMHAYPLPSFPGITAELVLQGLLRKKLDPSAATWIEESLASENNPGSELRPFSAEQMEELWSWARPASQEFLKSLLDNDKMESDYTLKEEELGIENVVTGIKSLDESEDEDEEMGDDEKAGAASKDPKSLPPAVPLEALLRFSSGRQLDPPAQIK